MATKIQKSLIWAKFGFQVDYDVANWYPSFGSHIISYLVVFAPFLIMSPKQSFRRHIVFALFIIKSPNKVWRLIFFAPFLIIIKSPNEVWRLIVFAPFLLIIIIIMNVCQNLWPHLYRKLPKGFPQDLAYILNKVGRIFWPKKNRERMAAIFKLAADKIGKISMFSDFNENLYPYFCFKRGPNRGEVYNRNMCINYVLISAHLSNSITSDNRDPNNALNSDMGVVWGLLCLHSNTIKPR
jgi:hypothetical protein